MKRRFSQALQILRDYEGTIDGPTRYNLLASLEPGLEAEESEKWQEYLFAFGKLCLQRGLSGKMARTAILAASKHPSISDALHAASEHMSRVTIKAVGMPARKNGIRFALLTLAEAIRTKSEDPETAIWRFVEETGFDNGAHCLAVLVSGFFGYIPEPRFPD
jgi:hypothetical protein